MIWRKRRGDCVDLTGITAEEKKKPRLLAIGSWVRKDGTRGK